MRSFSAVVAHGYQGAKVYTHTSARVCVNVSVIMSVCVCVCGMVTQCAEGALGPSFKGRKILISPRLH